VKLAKPEEKPPFQTWTEIERRIAPGGLTQDQIQDLWECLFLQLAEVEELLGYVKEHALQSWVYPMFCFAAHTGARRSEMIRAQVSDVDFDGGTVLIHEKKRAHDRRTTRRVPLTSFLGGVLSEWIKVHPGGTHLFCQASKVARSKKQRSEPTPVTRDEAHDHFKRTLAESKWKVLRGWHILRHSFASNCAAKGIDQRLLDTWLGHTTEIRKRYLHLIPSNERQAIQTVFG
jgi:integrase